MLEPSNPPPKVSLEQLLRLKRHERPAPEYWARFDRELRERALRVLVQPAPWYAQWSRLLVSRAAPWAMLGATSAVVLGFAMHSKFLQPPASLLPVTPVASAPLAAMSPAPAPMVAALSGAVKISPSSATTAAAADSLPAARSSYAVTSLAESSPSATYRTVHATVAFAAYRPEGARYAAEAETATAGNGRETGVAY